MQRSVPPPELLAALARWARRAVHGCTLELAWGQTSADPIAHVISLRPDTTYRAFHLQRDQATAARVCRLLADLLPPFATLLRRGADVDDILDALSLIWSLERRTPFAIPDRRARAQEAAVLERAAKIVERWSAALQSMTPWVRVEYPDGRWRATYLYNIALRDRDGGGLGFLGWLATTLRGLDSPVGARAHRRVLIVVRVLEELMRRRRVRVTARDVGDVVRAAWPALYQRDEFDVAAAARKLVARARRSVDAHTLARAFEVLPSSIRAIPAPRRRPIGNGIELVYPDYMPATPGRVREAGRSEPAPKRKKRR